MVKSVVRVHHWSPSEIDSLYLDGMGYLSLDFWYHDVVEVNESLKTDK